MGRCLSPCLGDLDPNLYRRRLDEALRLFVDGPTAPEAAAGPHVERPRCAAPPTASSTSVPPRCVVGCGRLGMILDRLEGALEATHPPPGWC